MGADGNAPEDFRGMTGFVSDKNAPKPSLEVAAEMDEILRGATAAQVQRFFAEATRAVSSPPVTHYRDTFRRELAPRFKGPGRDLLDEAPVESFTRREAQVRHARRLTGPLTEVTERVLGPRREHVMKRARTVFIAGKGGI
jgi:hypothetical protein